MNPLLATAIAVAAAAIGLVWVWTPLGPAGSAPLQQLGVVVIDAEAIEAVLSPSEDWLVWFVEVDLQQRASAAAAQLLHRDEVQWLEQVVRVYAEDGKPLRAAVASVIDRTTCDKYWPTTPPSSPLRLFMAGPLDRSCLLSLSPRLARPLEMTVPSSPPLDADRLWLNETVQWLNKKLNRHRQPDGQLTPLGHLLSSIHENIYQIPDKQDTCEEIQGLPDRDAFVRDFVVRSRPVILRGAIASWPAIHKWTNDFLRANLGEQEVHIKLTPDGAFEGCERLDLWPGQGSHIPARVRHQLVFDDIAVVRPAPANMRFHEFMDLLNHNANVSAYLEYTSISSSLPMLLRDIEPIPVAKDLAQEHLNIWLGNGKTVGKLHFDPFENLLCQVTGAKELTIFPPHENENFYEGHLAEAQLSFDRTSLTFSRDTLLESTSMVMSPVDITKPDLQRYPRFAKARSLVCEIRQGDVLFLPSFWWHEVRSKPDEHMRNIAVNFWFKPVLDKEFPCPECRQFASPTYYDLLGSSFGVNSQMSLNN